MLIYFSSTGNSLNIAKCLAKSLNDKAIHINKAKQIKGLNNKLIGIVFPTHYNNAPNLIQDFIRDFNFGDPEYIFSIVTHGGDPGNSLFTIKKLLENKNLKLFFGEEILMPVNSRIMYGGVATRVDELINKQKDIVDKIVDKIKNKEINTEHLEEKKIAKIVYSISNWRLVRNFFKLSIDKSRCIKCGICEKLCPVRNIKSTESGIKFGSNCQNCFGCIHWCPYRAIKIRNRKIKKKEQYHHPKVVVKEIMDIQYKV